MRHRINQPRGMKSHRGAQESTAKHQPESAHSEQRGCSHSCRNKVVLHEPDVCLVFSQIGEGFFSVATSWRKLAANKNPTRMQPPLAIARRRRIAFFVRVSVVLPMRGYPKQWAAFQKCYSAIVREYLDHFGVGNERWRAAYAQSQSTQ